MKKNIFIVLLSIILPIFAFSHEYFVEIEEKTDSFQLNLRTILKKNCMCPLRFYDVRIEKPTNVNYGMISLIVATDPKDICLMAFGYHRGSFIFYKDFQTLPNGIYYLIINDLNYGYLIISNFKVFLDPINCI
ncbi:MAG: hypothetical protein WCT85_03920 [Parachlamydiales bacterium]|jgi:hypothetical protein